jgi:hypothetical protein
MPTTDITNLLIPIITSSSLLIGAVALWVFYRGFRPIFIDFYKAFDSIFVKEDKQNIDIRIKKYLSIFVKLINRKARLRSSYLIKISDNIFAFNTINDNKHIFSYWSIDTFIRSWMLSLIYLVVMLFVVGYVDLDKSILWQFVFIFVYYILMFYVVCTKYIFSKIQFFLLFLASVLIIEIALKVQHIVAIAVYVAISAHSVIVGSFAIVGAIIGALMIVSAMIIYSDGTIFTQNLFQLLPILNDISPQEIVYFFIVFFFIMPISNALIDSLSLSVSRYEFQKLLNKKTYSFPFFLKVSLVDFLYALVFKLLILGVLYAGAFFFEKTGGTFQVNNIIIYFNYMTKAILQNGTFSFLFTGSTNTMITLMVSTTLLPTIIHFVTVLFNTIWAFLANSIELLRLFLKTNGLFFSAFMAFLFLLLFLLLFFMIFYILKII